MVSSPSASPVVFIISNADDPARAEPVGTGFFIHGQDDFMAPEEAWVYVVTCGHVVRDTPQAGIRFALDGGGTRDYLVKRWYHHPTEDVAVADFNLTDDLAFTAFGVYQGLLETTEHQPSLGERVQYTGLLGQVPSMGTSLTPMVRTGSIGALYQHGVPMVDPHGTMRHVRGHLLDCNSISGFSGSPVTVRFDRNTGKNTTRLGLALPESFYYLVGMIGGHFDVSKSVQLSSAERIQIPLGTGVGVVYTFDLIYEALHQEELVELRRK